MWRVMQPLQTKLQKRTSAVHGRSTSKLHNIRNTLNNPYTRKITEKLRQSFIKYKKQTSQMSATLKLWAKQAV